jgi:hypothetical protein
MAQGIVQASKRRIRFFSTSLAGLFGRACGMKDFLYKLSVSVASWSVVVILMVTGLDKWLVNTIKGL